MAVTQEDLDNLGTQIAEVDQKLKAGVDAVQKEVDSLEQQIEAGTPPADLSLEGVNTALVNLGTDVEGVGEIRPTPAEPTGQGQAPTKADGTAATNETDPEKAAEQ